MKKYLMLIFLVLLSCKTYVSRAPITEDELKNMTYDIGEPLKLSGGNFKIDKPFTEVHFEQYVSGFSITNTTESFVRHPIAFVILSDTDGGKGLFYHLAVVIREHDGMLGHVKTVFLGNRAEIKSIKVTNQMLDLQIKVEQEVEFQLYRYLDGALWRQVD